MSPDGNPTHQFTIFDAFPTWWDPGEHSSSSNVACETIVCKMGRVELAAIDSDGDDGDLPGRADLYAWINATASGQDSRRSVTKCQKSVKYDTRQLYS